MKAYLGQEVIDYGRLTGGDDFTSFIVNGRYASFEDHVIASVDLSRGSRLQTLQENDSSADLVSIPPLKNIWDGKQYSTIYSPGGLIAFCPKSADAETVEACMTYLDWLCTEEGGFAISHPAVVRLGERYFLYYSVLFGDILGIGIAFSDDMERWQEYGRFPATQECESTGVGAPGAIVRDGKVHLFYQTYGTWEKDAICHAWSEDGLHFEKDESNPVFRPTADWCCGRAIDADVCRFKDRYYLYFATRDHEMRIQKLGAAWTPLTSDFSRNSWTQACRHAILAPEMVWEQECTEAPACVVDRDRLYLFYGGAYNRKPQQIGCAVSEDGIHFEKMDSLPFLTNGEPGSWNAEESGHPFAFRDTDGTVWLFYQGFDGETWRITRTKLDFRDGRPVLVI